MVYFQELQEITHQKNISNYTRVQVLLDNIIVISNINELRIGEGGSH